MLRSFAAILTFALVVSSNPHPSYVVVGSSNVDVFLPRTRDFAIPLEDNLNVDGSVNLIAGGKGLNQAKALAKLAAAKERVKFVTCFDGAHPLSSTLSDAVSAIDAEVLAPATPKSSPPVSPGVGVVFTSAAGEASAVVVSGSNVLFPPLPAERLPPSCSALLLQNEVPSETNEQAMSLYPDAITIFDMGGVDRPPPSRPVRFLTMNEAEADRCLLHLPSRPSPSALDAKAKAAFILDHTNAQHVIVTLGGSGLCLASRSPKTALSMPCTYKPTTVVDTTGAGDCFRAALAYAMLEGGKGVEEACGWAMECAGRSVEAEGATCPRAEEVVGMLRGGGGGDYADFGSRLNSMKDRRDLCPPDLSNDVEGWVSRQGMIKGLTVVDFNFPEHISEATDLGEVKAWLDKAGLRAGAVCLRYPKSMIR